MSGLLIAFYLGGVVCEAASEYDGMVGFYPWAIVLWPLAVVIAAYDAFRRAFPGRSP